jgi:hypothetical protein
MTGINWGWSSAQWARTLVLDSGTDPKGSSLKVMYSSWQGRGDELMGVAYLEIQGKIEQPSRPFLYEYMGVLFSGVCHPAY